MCFGILRGILGATASEEPSVQQNNRHTPRLQSTFWLKLSQKVPGGRLSVRKKPPPCSPNRPWRYYDPPVPTPLALPVNALALPVNAVASHHGRFIGRRQAATTNFPRGEANERVLRSMAHFLSEATLWVKPDTDTRCEELLTLSRPKSLERQRVNAKTFFTLQLLAAFLNSS
jgi:hypothetical protein